MPSKCNSLNGQVKTIPWGAFLIRGNFDSPLCLFIILSLKFFTTLRVHTIRWGAIRQSFLNKDRFPPLRRPTPRFQKVAREIDRCTPRVSASLFRIFFSRRSPDRQRAAIFSIVGTVDKVFLVIVQIPSCFTSCASIPKQLQEDLTVCAVCCHRDPDPVCTRRVTNLPVSRSAVAPYSRVFPPPRSSFCSFSDL